MLNDDIPSNLKTVNVLDYGDTKYQNLDFSCRAPDFQQYFFDELRQDNRLGKVAGFIVLDGDEVVGYYSLIVNSYFNSINSDDQENIISVLPIRCVQLDRLAKNSNYTNPDAARILLADAISNAETNYASEEVNWMKINPIHPRSAELVKEFGGHKLECSNEMIIFLETA